VTGWLSIGIFLAGIYVLIEAREPYLLGYLLFADILFLAGIVGATFSAGF